MTPLQVHLKRVDPRRSPSQLSSAPRVSSTPYSHSNKRVDTRPSTVKETSPHKIFTTPCKVLIKRNHKIQPAVKCAQAGAITPVRVRLKRIDQRRSPVKQTSSSKVSSTPNPDSLNRIDAKPMQERKILPTVKDAPAGMIICTQFHKHVLNKLLF